MAALDAYSVSIRMHWNVRVRMHWMVVKNAALIVPKGWPTVSDKVNVKVDFNIVQNLELRLCMVHNAMSVG